MLNELKARGVEFTDWAGWLKLNQHELSLGAAFDGVERERVKVVARNEQVAISNR
jgi:ferredoxin--NADP+ reductase